MSRLLLIDDDARLREMLSSALARAGHIVIEARDGRQGANLFRAAPPDLVITDLVMPEQEGLETIIELHREWPALPIIAISGGGSLYLAMAAKLGAHRILAKPFALSVLLLAVAELLASPAPG
ncbi:MAG: response regulator receiver domain [Lacunisphaera sp.]|nr:response regulator receiver domain [Lacunisphaera sp.]MDB6165513.1 response regulator receiver domain [Lacunisphaera sp.]